MVAPRFLKDLATAIGLGHPADSFAAARPSAFAPIVLGGCGRSGTTLLRMMLDSHRRICCGPESSLFRRRALDPGALADRFGFPREAVCAIYEASRSRPAFIEGFAALCMQQSGKQRWAEKTPRNISRIGEIFRCFPEARFIHVLRDGRDVACSLRTHPRHKVGDGKLVPLETWKPIAGCAQRWREDIEGSRRWWGDPRFQTVRYEELVLNARPVLERLMAFLGEGGMRRCSRTPRRTRRFGTRPALPRIPRRSAVSTARQPLAARPRRQRQAHLQGIAGPLLIELGYAKDDGW
jgi:hypothetical protein